MVWTHSDVRGASISSSPIAFSSDEKRFLCTNGNTVRLFHLTTGEEIVRILGHTDLVTRVLTTDQANEFISSSLDGTVRSWSFKKVDRIESTQYIWMVQAPILDMRLDPAHGSNAVFLHISSSGGSHIVRLNLTKNSKDNVEVIHKFRKKITTFDVSANYVVVASANKVSVISRKTKNSVKDITTKGDVKAVGISAEEDCIFTTSKEEGAITLHFNFLKDYTTQRLSWHSNSPNAVVFSKDGKNLSSAGQEAVIVNWHIETGSQKFLPRLGGPVQSISISPSSQYYGVAFCDNAIKIVSSLSHHLVKSVPGLRRANDGSLLYKKDYENRKKYQTPLLVEPINSYSVLPGTPGSIQFYDVIKDKGGYEFEVAPRNAATKMGTKYRIPDAVVHFVSFSGDGKCMATIDDRTILSGNEEKSLKFWTYDTDLGKYVLNTKVENPHEERINGLAFHPTKYLVATSSKDSKFKLWTRFELNPTPRKEDTENEKGANKKMRTEQKAGDSGGTESGAEYAWICRSVGSYKSYKARSVAFSSDGSILAVAYDPVLTLWDPATNTLLHELAHGDKSEKIKSIAFVPNSPFLISFTENWVHVWNVVTSRIHLSYQIHSHALAVSPDGGLFAVAAHDFHDRSSQFIVLFSVNNQRPIHSWKLREKAVAVSFLSRQNLIQRGSAATAALFYLTSKEELFVIENFEFEEIEDTQAQGQGEMIEKEPPMDEKGEDADEATSVTQSTKGENSMESQRKKTIQKDNRSKITKLLSAPVSSFPGLEILYDQFMNLLLEKSDDKKGHVGSSESPNQATQNEVKVRMESEGSTTPMEVEVSNKKRNLKRDKAHLQKVVELFDREGSKKAETKVSKAIEEGRKEKKEMTPKEEGGPSTRSKKMKVDDNTKSSDGSQTEPINGKKGKKKKGVHQNGLTEEDENGSASSLEQVKEDFVDGSVKKEELAQKETPTSKRRKRRDSNP